MAYFIKKIWYIKFNQLTDLITGNKQTKLMNWKCDCIFGSRRIFHFRNPIYLFLANKGDIGFEMLNKVYDKTCNQLKWYLEIITIMLSKNEMKFQNFISVCPFKNYYAMKYKNFSINSNTFIQYKIMQEII